mgnify:CR=1
MIFLKKLQAFTVQEVLEKMAIVMATVSIATSAMSFEKGVFFYEETVATTFQMYFLSVIMFFFFLVSAAIAKNKKEPQHLELVLFSMLVSTMCVFASMCSNILVAAIFSAFPEFLILSMLTLTAVLTVLWITSIVQEIRVPSYSSYS